MDFVHPDRFDLVPSETPESSRAMSRDRSPEKSQRDANGTDQNQDTPAPSNVLGVFGMSKFTTESDLETIMSKYGRLAKCVLVREGRSGPSRGYAFVTFEKVEDADRARQETNGMTLNERNIRVDFSRTLRAHDPTPGRFMGRDDQKREFGRSGDDRRDDGYRRRSRSRSRNGDGHRSRRDHSDSRDRRHGHRNDSRDRHHRRSRSRSRDRGFRDRSRSRDRYQERRGRNGDRSPRFRHRDSPPRHSNDRRFSPRRDRSRSR